MDNHPNNPNRNSFLPTIAEMQHLLCTEKVHYTDDQQQQQHHHQQQQQQQMLRQQQHFAQQIRLQQQQLQHKQQQQQQEQLLQQQQIPFAQQLQRAQQAALQQRAAAQHQQQLQQQQQQSRNNPPYHKSLSAPAGMAAAIPSAAAAGAHLPHQLIQQQQQQQQPQQQPTHFGLIGADQKPHTAGRDQTFLADRCLDNLLRTEEKLEEPTDGGAGAGAGGHRGSYFELQPEITPAMRRIVAEWMMEVCEENKCQEEVFLLALNYMDRFLCTTLVSKVQLQILAAACLLLASKLREPSCLGLPADLLVFYTDNSIKRADLLQWELCVLSRLKWDISTVTPLDFLELLLMRLPISNKKCPDVDSDKIRKHAQAYISLAAREYNFHMFSASTVGAASIVASLHGMNWPMRCDIQMDQMVERLCALIGVKQHYLSTCITQMELIFEQTILQQESLQTPAAPASASASASAAAAAAPSYLLSITAQNIPASPPQPPPAAQPAAAAAAAELSMDDTVSADDASASTVSIAGTLVVGPAPSSASTSASASSSPAATVTSPTKIADDDDDDDDDLGVDYLPISPVNSESDYVPYLEPELVCNEDISDLDTNDDRADGGGDDDDDSAMVAELGDSDAEVVTEVVIDDDDDDDFVEVAAEAVDYHIEDGDGDSRSGSSCSSVGDGNRHQQSPLSEAAQKPAQAPAPAPLPATKCEESSSQSGTPTDLADVLF